MNSLTDRLTAAAALAAGGHNGDTGSNRESALVTALNEHLPRRLQATLGGQVYSDDGESEQIDVLVTNDLGMRFAANDKQFVIAESVVAAISVKSTLDSHSGRAALVGLWSIPAPSRHFLRVRDWADFSSRWPKYVLFAYSGLSPASATQLLEATAGQRLELLERTVIVMHRQYVLYWVPANGNRDALWQVNEAGGEIRGLPFAWLVDRLTDYTRFMADMSVDSSPYRLTSAGRVGSPHL